MSTVGNLVVWPFKLIISGCGLILMLVWNLLKVIISDFDEHPDVRYSNFVGDIWLGEIHFWKWRNWWKLLSNIRNILRTGMSYSVRLEPSQRMLLKFSTSNQQTSVFYYFLVSQLKDSKNIATRFSSSAEDTEPSSRSSLDNIFTITGNYKARFINL